MRTRLFGLGVAVLLCTACAGENPVSPLANGASASRPADGTVSTVVDHRAEQVVFSGQVPPGIFDGTGAQDVDFWVWCEHGGANNSYHGECQGSMGVDALTQAVSGTVHMVPDFDSSLGMDHVIDVQSKDGSIACELRNHLPLTTGPTSTVDVDCSSPSVTGTFNGAVVLTTESPRT